ncbi:MAG TPA: hypothetical protein VIJ12_09990 [Candidatus Baltobacteraceae bacterium]
MGESLGSLFGSAFASLFASVASVFGSLFASPAGCGADSVLGSEDALDGAFDRESLM